MKKIVFLVLAFVLMGMMGCRAADGTQLPEMTTVYTAGQTEPALPEHEAATGRAELTVSFTSTPVAQPDADISGGYTPAVDIMLWTDRAITDVRIVSLGFDDDGRHFEDKTLHRIDALDEHDDAFILRMVFWGDIPSTGLAYTDADGSERLYSIGMSGKDGSLVLDEILPAPAVVLAVEAVTPTGLTLIATSSTELVYGKAYWIECEEAGVWTSLTALTDTVMWEAIGILLPAGQPTEIKLSWSNLFGSLAPGHYRIVKDFGALTYWAEFTIV